MGGNKIIFHGVGGGAGGGGGRGGEREGNVNNICQRVDISEWVMGESDDPECLTVPPGMRLIWDGNSSSNSISDTGTVSSCSSGSAESGSEISGSSCGGGRSGGGGGVGGSGVGRRPYFVLSGLGGGRDDSG